MRENFEQFSFILALVMGGCGVGFLFSGLKQKSSSAGKIAFPFFIIAGLFLIPGWNTLYSLGLLNPPQEAKQVNNSPESKPIIQVMREEYQKQQQQTNEQPVSQPSAPVYNNGWDGSVRQVKEWLKDNLKDPDSFEAIGWTAVQKTLDGGYSVRCKYRAKNSFGGNDIYNQIFYMDSEGNVLRYVDVSE